MHRLQSVQPCGALSRFGKSEINARINRIRIIIRISIRIRIRIIIIIIKLIIKI